jgi:hypothetical protein
MVKYKTVSMQKSETKGAKGLRHPVMTRISHAKYLELEKIASKTKDETISGIVRSIIHNQPVKVFVKDETLNTTMEELAALRSEIRAIGVNINQITRWFNTYPEPRQKEFYAKIAFGKYMALEGKIDRLLEIISNLAEKWLSE